MLTSTWRIPRDPATATPNETWQYTYNGMGQVTQVDRGVQGLTTYAYGSLEQLLSVTTAAGTVSYNYDSKQRLQQVLRKAPPRRPDVEASSDHERIALAEVRP